MRAKGKKCIFFLDKVLYCEKTTVLTLLVQLEKITSLSCQTEGVFQLIYYSSELLPRKLNRRLTKYLAKEMSIKKMFHCVYSSARPANRLPESVENGKLHSPVMENPIAQNSEVL